MYKRNKLYTGILLALSLFIASGTTAAYALDGATRDENTVIETTENVEKTDEESVGYIEEESESALTEGSKTDDSDAVESTVIEQNVSMRGLDTHAIMTAAELQEALNNANDGDTIILSKDYVPSSVTLTLPANATVTIDGSNVDQKGEGISISGTNAKTTTFKNFIFTAGTTTAWSIRTSSPVLLENFKVSGRHTSGNSAGVSAYDMMNLTIRNASFIDNSKSHPGYAGGAIEFTDLRGSVTIENSFFLENYTEESSLGAAGYGGQGGAISVNRMHGTGVLTITGSLFDGNSAAKDATGTKANIADGGALSVFNIVQGGQILIDRTTFRNNIAGDDGGAILIQTNDDQVNDITIQNSTFVNNEARGASAAINNGGAIQFFANGSIMSSKRTSTATINNNTFVGNKAAGNGSAIGFLQYGFYNKVYGEFNNNLFVANISANDSVVAGNKTITNTNNMGYNSGLTMESVFGAYPTNTVTHSSPIVGYKTDGNRLPVIMTSPVALIFGNAVESQAHNGVDVGANPSYNVVSTDQLGNVRSSTAQDFGAIEIGSVAFHANGGIFKSEAAQTIYDGTVYKVANSDQEILVVYAVAPSGGNVTEPSEPVMEGRVFKGWSLTPTGEVLSASELSALTHGVSETVMVYAVYEDEIIKAPITIEYVDFDGNAIPGYPAKQIEGIVGETYDVSAMKEIIAGYEYVQTDGEVTGTLTDAGVTVRFIYNVIRINGGVEIHYVDADGNVISGYPMNRVEGEVGSAFNVSGSKVIIPGYTFVSTQGALTGNFTEATQTVIHTYKKDAAVGPMLPETGLESSGIAGIGAMSIAAGLLALIVAKRKKDEE